MLESLQRFPVGQIIIGICTINWTNHMLKFTLSRIQFRTMDGQITKQSNNEINWVYISSLSFSNFLFWVYFSFMEEKNENFFTSPRQQLSRANGKSYLRNELRRDAERWKGRGTGCWSYVNCVGASDRFRKPKKTSVARLTTFYLLPFTNRLPTTDCRQQQQHPLLFLNFCLNCFLSALFVRMSAYLATSNVTNVCLHFLILISKLNNLLKQMNI